jgi:hypothetical protein
MTVTDKKTRVWASVSQELKNWTEDAAKNRGIATSAFVETILSEESQKGEGTLVLDLDVAVVEQLREIAERENRTLEGQIVWILKNWVKIRGKKLGADG